MKSGPEHCIQAVQVNTFVIQNLTGSTINIILFINCFPNPAEFHYLDEDLKDVFGMAVTVVTNVADTKEAKAFLTYLGFPFKKA